ncbi:hypothetical protein D3C76_1349980 [compost metagenome]
MISPEGCSPHANGCTNCRAWGRWDKNDLSVLRSRWIRRRQATLTSKGYLPFWSELVPTVKASCKGVMSLFPQQPNFSRLPVQLNVLVS